MNYHIIERDVVDLGDDGEGYVAYPIFVCTICGVSGEALDTTPCTGGEV